jgi:uncharacterized protein
VLRERITDDMKTAMRAKDAPRLNVIRLLQAAIKQREVDERITLDDTQTLGVLEKMVKQRRESIAQFEVAKRQDLIDQERFEIDVLKVYLPEPMSDADVDALIDTTVAETGAMSVKDMGRLMAALKTAIAGRADMQAVSQKVKARFAP